MFLPTGSLLMEGSGVGSVWTGSWVSFGSSFSTVFSFTAFRAACQEENVFQSITSEWTKENLMQKTENLPVLQTSL